MEAICLRLLERHPAPMSASAERTRQKSRHQLVVADYHQLRCRLFYSSETLRDVPLQLYPINQTTLLRW